MSISPVTIKAATVLLKNEGLKPQGASFEAVLNAAKDQHKAPLGPASPIEIVKTSPVQHVIASITHTENRLRDLVNKGLTVSNMPQEKLIALQAQVYSATLEIDVFSKGLEQTTSGCKTLLQSQI
jgi:hypothetical protein